VTVAGGTLRGSSKKAKKKEQKAEWGCLKKELKGDRPKEKKWKAPRKITSLGNNLQVKKA